MDHQQQDNSYSERTHCVVEQNSLWFYDEPVSLGTELVVSRMWPLVLGARQLETYDSAQYPMAKCPLQICGLPMLMQ